MDTAPSAPQGHSHCRYLLALSVGPSQRRHSTLIRQAFLDETEQAFGAKTTMLSLRMMFFSYCIAY